MSFISSINPLYSLSGLVVGLLVGQTGVGGGSLMTPLLILLFGIHPATAVGTDLLFAAITKSSGTLVHGLNKTVNWQVTGRLATGSVPATGVTLFLVSYFDVPTGEASGPISTILGIALILTAISLIFRKQVLMLAASGLDALTPARVKWLTVLTGAVLGVLVSLSSVGAGALGVTALILALSADPARRDRRLRYRARRPIDALRRNWPLADRLGGLAAARIAAAGLDPRHHVRKFSFLARAGMGLAARARRHAHRGRRQARSISRAAPLSLPPRTPDRARRSGRRWYR